MTDPNPDEIRDATNGRFLPGHKGGGRPRGSRNKLAESFVDALYADWQANGEAVIAQVRADKPDQYLKVVASLLPKQVEVRDQSIEDLSDEELADALDALLTVRSVLAGHARTTRNSGNGKARRSQEDGGEPH